MPFVIPGLFLVLALVALPQLWIARVMRRHSEPRPALPGTGGQFARHLLDGMKLGHVKVEETDLGDHYHPIDKAVRLKPAHFTGKSLTAVVIAAHEVGHAMQDATGYAPLRRRTRLAAIFAYVQRGGTILIFASPIIAALVHHPIGLAAGIAAGVILNASAIFMHAVTLPVEFDASFNRALPVLREGRYVAPEDLGAARRILSAAAYTYVAAALLSVLNVARWIRR